jgi:hypothetical protein
MWIKTKSQTHTWISPQPQLVWEVYFPYNIFSSSPWGLDVNGIFQNSTKSLSKNQGILFFHNVGGSQFLQNIIILNMFMHYLISLEAWVSYSYQALELELISSPNSTFKW